MSSFNRVILMGNLTRDIELRYTQSGMAVCDMGLAINERRKDAGGEWIEEAVFVDVTLFGRTAEVAEEYLKKGFPVMIEGRLKLDQWEGNDGQKRQKLKVFGERLQLVGGRQGGDGGGRRQPEGGNQPRGDRRTQPQDDYGDAYDRQPPSAGDDIPF